MTDTLLVILCALTATTALLVWRQQRTLDELRLDVSEIQAQIDDSAGEWELDVDDAPVPSCADSGTYTWS